LISHLCKTLCEISRIKILDTVTAAGETSNSVTLAQLVYFLSIFIVALSRLLLLPVLVTLMKTSSEL
jgi:hypothetical protein